MRNPNYKYIPNPDTTVGGYFVSGVPPYTTEAVWGKTKAAARSRLKRMLNRHFKNMTTEEIYKALQSKGETNDQS